MTPVKTHSQKQVRAKEKKKRHAEKQFRETNNPKYILKRDSLEDEINKLKQQQEVVVQVAKKAKVVACKSDDQILNEGIRQARKERNAAEKIKKDEDKKKKELFNSRNNVKGILKKKKMLKNKKQTKEQFVNECFEMDVQKKKDKDDFTKQYLLANPTCGPSDLQKEFTRFKKVRVETINILMSIGFNEKDAEGCFQKINGGAINIFVETDVVDPDRFQKINDGVIKLLMSAEMSEKVEDEGKEGKDELWCLDECCLESTHSFTGIDEYDVHMMTHTSQEINDQSRL